MKSSLKKKREWAEALIHKLDPSFKQRWEIYDGILERLSGPDTRWLDGGCGSNIAIEEFPGKLTVGIDSCLHPDVSHNPPFHFVQGNLERMPFRNEAFTLVTMNTVAEHIGMPEIVFDEMCRILSPGGYVLVHTTNIHSPLIFLGKLLPDFIRRRIFTELMSAYEHDVFKTFHRINTLQAFRKIEGFEIEEFHYVQNLYWPIRPLFLFLLAYHLISRIPGLRWLRTNLIVLMRKKTPQE